ncbi:hypothetical protein BDP55DRAFT_627217 [Colletotrichum godetiae]|uniref:Uncharacterized protein n=1 Tax=Colletotrichum godetiae TaxID=1209918 RepID=A0AAJ0AWD7_9PEZI|nr:uncharacterized protein BDP55DRAFT_627217 [Colletotrichum godetiae]KAK1691574.1 hypothetical protein BDP55DRAFT_627217 [Colletotrichum godetiae]
MVNRAERVLSTVAYGRQRESRGDWVGAGPVSTIPCDMSLSGKTILSVCTNESLGHYFRRHSLAALSLAVFGFVAVNMRFGGFNICPYTWAIHTHKTIGESRQVSHTAAGSNLTRANATDCNTSRWSDVSQWISSHLQSPVLEAARRGAVITGASAVTRLAAS